MQQIDIFNDTQATSLANDVVAALADHDDERAAQSIAALRREEPDYRDLAAFDTLQAFLEHRGKDSALADVVAIAARVRRIDEFVQPAAAVLGNRADDFLRPIWRRLAATTHAFDGAFPEAHRAALLLRAGDREAAETAAREIAGGQRLAVVQRWLCLARHPRFGLDGVLAPLFRFAWLAPSRLEEIVAELDDPLLTKAWREFLGVFGDLDASWFPAWYLAEHRAASFIDEAIPDEIPAAAACRRLVRILALEKQGHSPALVAQRAKLKALDETFFAWYMARRSVLHR
ncbi:MAG: hypothetical protein Q8O52_21970 [Sulfuritalea sp.]|nr:hypothetical protein [Sulfuritalea sp.]